MKLLIIFLITLNFCFAGTLPNNDYKVGIGASVLDKGFTFDTGDGVNNKVLKVDDTGKLKYSGNNAQLGDGTTGNDKCITLDSSADSKICWDGTEQKLIFNNGNSSTDKKFGSGSGSGGGENFNNGFGADDNANAEDGTTNWTTNGGGTFAVTAVDPIEGEQSFTYTPSAQNDFVESVELDFDRDVMKGRSCQASIEYIGGDTNLTLKVLNTDDEVLGSLTLPAHTITAQESVFFICPSDADITGDADKGELRLRVENTGASAAPLIKFDKSYVGTLTGLSEAVLPDVFSAKVSTTDTVSSENVNWINGDCTDATTGEATCNFMPGIFTVAPNCSATVDYPTGARGIQVVSVSSSSVTLRSFSTGGADVNMDFALICQKAAPDAKQSVQVYKSIPKVSTNINSFTAKVSSAGVVSAENTNWINGNCVTSDTSLQTCSFNASLFSVSPNCTTSVNSSATANDLTALIDVVSSATIAVRTMNNTAKSAQAFTINCQKSDTDFEMPTVQPIIVGQVANSYAQAASKNVSTESCQVTNTGSPVTNNSLCNNWVSSITDAGTAYTRLNFTAGVFDGVNAPVCVASSMDSAENKDCKPISTTATYVDVRCEDEPTGGNEDQDFSVICQGRK